MKHSKVTRNIMIAVAVLALWVAQIACDSSENPCVNAACGLISPVTQIESQIINAVDSNPCDNISASC